MSDVQDQLRQTAAALPTFGMPTASSLMQNAAGRRRRRRMLAAAGLTALVGIFAVGAYVQADHDSEGLRTVESPDATTASTEPAPVEGTIIVPDVMGLDVVDAIDGLDRASLTGVVNEGDAALSPALVLAQEPPAAERVATGAVVGLRTLFPDPPESLECGGYQHPHGPASADGLPTVDVVTDRGLAEDVVRTLRGERGPNVFLAQWDRYAWQRVDGEVQVVPTVGYQVIIVHDGPECGPVKPAFYPTPVTEVRGPLDAFAASLAEPRD